MEVLKQPQFSPYTTAQQYAILFASVNGHLMSVDTKNVSDFVKGFLEYLADHNASIMESLDSNGVSDIEMDNEITEALETYKHIIQTQP